MDLDKESKSEEKRIFFFLGGAGGGGGGGGFQPKKRKHKKQNVLANFCAHALYKISSSWLKWFSSFKTNKRSNGQVRAKLCQCFTEFSQKSS